MAQSKSNLPTPRPGMEWAQVPVTRNGKQFLRWTQVRSGGKGAQSSADSALLSAPPPMSDGGDDDGITEAGEEYLEDLADRGLDYVRSHLEDGVRGNRYSSLYEGEIDFLASSSFGHELIDSGSNPHWFFLNGESATLSSGEGSPIDEMSKRFARNACADLLLKDSEVSAAARGMGWDEQESSQMSAEELPGEWDEQWYESDGEVLPGLDNPNIRALYDSIRIDRANPVQASADILSATLAYHDADLTIDSGTTLDGLGEGRTDRELARRISDMYHLSGSEEESIARLLEEGEIPRTGELSYSCKPSPDSLRNMIYGLKRTQYEPGGSRSDVRGNSNYGYLNIGGVQFDTGKVSVALGENTLRISSLDEVRSKGFEQAAYDSTNGDWEYQDSPRLF